jgi:hypothetical protein
MRHHKLKARRLDLERKYLNKFCSKHSYGRFEFCSGERYVWDFANFDIYEIFYDIDNDCQVDEIFKWFYWTLENESRLNFDTWIRLGGSENIDEMNRLFAKKQQADLEQSRKNVIESRKILDAEIERFMNEN